MADIPKNNKALKALVNKYQLELLMLFGSQATGHKHKESDLDIAYLSTKALSIEKESRLITDLAPLLGSENIDLVNLRKASPLLLYAITQNAKILFAKNGLIFPALRAFAFKQFVETKPLYQLKLERIKQKFL